MTLDQFLVPQSLFQSPMLRASLLQVPFFQQGDIVFSLLLSRLGLALLYACLTLLALLIVPGFVQRSVVAGTKIRFGGYMSQRRQDTIARMMLTMSRIAIFVVGLVAVLSLFVSTNGLFTFLGLFTAAMGFALRGLIGDYISGFIFLFEDQFVIGDDVQVGGERGAVEDVTMRTTTLRAPSGEKCVVPNGDIRTVFNYSRADRGEVTVMAAVPSAETEAAMTALTRTVRTQLRKIPALTEVPTVSIEDGALGDTVTITVRAQTVAGSEDDVRRRLIHSVRTALVENEIVMDSPAPVTNGDSAGSK